MSTKILHTVFLVLAACTTCSSQTTTFQKTYGGSGDEDGYHILALPGGYLIAGYTTSAGHGGKDAYLLRLDADGNILWQRTYGGSSEDQFTLVTEANDGGFLAMGDTHSAGGGGNDIFLTKVDDNGNVVWSKTMGSSGDDIAPIEGDIQRVPNGYLISGHQYNYGGSSPGAYFVRLDNSGGLVWEKSFTIGGYNYLVSTAVAGDTAYIGGSIDGEGTFGKMSITDGQIWSLQTYPQPFSEALYNTRVTQDGQILISDVSPNGSEQRQWVMKLRTDGSVIWCQAYGPSGRQHPGPGGVVGRWRFYIESTQPGYWHNQ